MKTSDNIVESALREMGIEIPDNLGDLTLEEVGLDSIEMVDLIAAVGQRLGTDPPDVLDRDLTVRDLLEHFDHLAAATDRPEES